MHESLTQLELINKQYRRLARENRTDSSCRLREMANESNQRWDDLQKRVASILRRLKVHASFIHDFFIELKVQFPHFSDLPVLLHFESTTNEAYIILSF